LRTDARSSVSNNRDLSTFKVDFKHDQNFIVAAARAERAVVRRRERHLTAAQVKELYAAGVSAILVGTSLMKSQDVGAKIRN